MNKRDAKKFEKLLLAERARLSSGIEKLEKDTLYQPVSDNSTDLTSLAEVGTDSFERETALNIASGEAAWLREVSDALKRIRNGEFGICEGCAAEIPKKRLEVFPSARYCVECQSKLERDGTL
ncbi:MAG: TraR/DksA C4-type zinc finger protein [Candidatus Hydrogenedentes bacterium]|nr:TraR/DksA C4-type zinc finger protein [Candidatus Hydrogenedentota bacterium]